jgi:ABC-type multidrug transport system permease subunit
MNQSFSNVIPVLNIFIKEKEVISKELASKSYRLYNYYFSKILAEIPFNIINPLTFVIITYFVV